MTILSREDLVKAIAQWPPQQDLEGAVRAELIAKGESWVTERPHLRQEPEQILHAAGFRGSEVKVYVEWHGMDLWFDRADLQDLVRE